MPFDTLEQGDKVDLHLHLRQRHVELIDRLRERYNCSRSAAVEALLDEYAPAVIARLAGKREEHE